MNVTKIIESTESNAVCCLLVPNYILDTWYCTRNSSAASFVDKLNMSIVGQALQVKKGRAVEERIRTHACKLNKKLQGKSKRMKKSIKERSSRITIYNSEVESDWVSTDDYR